MKPVESREEFIADLKQRLPASALEGLPYPFVEVKS